MAYGDYGKTTELEAINECLGVIGEQPVNAVPTSGVSKASIARDLIYKLSRDTQNEGLLCNTEENYELSVNESNEFVLPANCLDVDTTNLGDRQWVERNGKMYDTENKTFTATITTLLVDLILFLTWDELPEHVRAYITIRAARIFQKRYLGDGDVHRYSEEDEFAAMRQFQRKELRNKDFSILDNPFLNRRR